MKKEKLTSTVLSEFKGNPVISIYEVDAEGNNVSEHAIISFGRAKARVILKHTKDIEEFLSDLEAKESL